ncbi:MAG TPA: metallophosphoesterase [Candidatus Fimousia stercorigallinarum]|nr:metallophosphoesterase [Candidatus Fimousia stercorigallinarum]
MNILVVADVESKYLWDYFDSSQKEKVDLIISCGDLDADYLSFLTTMYNCDVLYVHGNHDEGYETKPPEGCICIDDQIINYQGIRILGLGGSMRYNNGKYQYTEAQMRMRYMRLWLQIQLCRGFDILVTHAPARGMNDADDPPHRGFECFHDLISKYKPAFFLHGHVHLNYGYDIPRIEKLGNTTVINGFEKYQFEYKI